MPRINFEDDVESHQQFWNLFSVVNDRDKCLGLLVRFFRLAQTCFSKGEAAISKVDLDRYQLSVMIESGWAVAYKDGYQVTNPEKHFAWLIQKAAAGRKSGESRRRKRDNLLNGRSTYVEQAPAEMQKALASAASSDLLDARPQTGAEPVNEYRARRLNGRSTYVERNPGSVEPPSLYSETPAFKNPKSDSPSLAPQAKNQSPPPSTTGLRPKNGGGVEDLKTLESKFETTIRGAFHILAGEPSEPYPPPPGVLSLVPKLVVAYRDHGRFKRVISEIIDDTKIKNPERYLIAVLNRVGKEP